MLVPFENANAIEQRISMAFIRHTQCQWHNCASVWNRGGLLIATDRLASEKWNRDLFESMCVKLAHNTSRHTTHFKCVTINVSMRWSIERIDVTSFNWCRHLMSSYIFHVYLSILPTIRYLFRQIFNSISAYMHSLRCRRTSFSRHFISIHLIITGLCVCFPKIISHHSVYVPCTKTRQ